MLVSWHLAEDGTCDVCGKEPGPECQLFTAGKVSLCCSCLNGGVEIYRKWKKMQRIERVYPKVESKR